MVTWLANEKLNKAIDTLSKVIQIIAIGVAGWWAYNQFFVTVKPGLEFRGMVDTDLNWAKSSDLSDCQADLHITITNNGLSSFNISWVGVRGWLFTSDPKLSSAKDFSISKPTVQAPVSVDYDKIEETVPFYSVESSAGVNSSNLLGHYPPGAKSGESSVWWFKKAKGQGVIFKVDVKTTDTATQFVPNSWVMDETCNLTEPDKKKD